MQAISSMNGYHQKPLGAYLVEAGLLSPAQVEVILADQQRIKMRFGEIVAARGWVKQETVEYFVLKIISPDRSPSIKTPATSSVAPQQRRVSLSQNPNTTLPQKTPLANSGSTGDEEEIPWVG